MNNVKIAVVTPVYNGENTIVNSINSLIHQNFKEWISIIVNDGSTDKTIEVLNKYSNDDRFIIINLEKNVGRGEARKIALKKVKDINAKYMCMLDADDLFYEDKLEWQFNYMEKNLNIALMSCSIGYIDNNNKLLGVLETFEEEKILSFNNFMDYVPVPHACSIIRTSEIGNITFDENLTLGQDQDFMIRMLINKKYSFIPRIGYLYNRTDSFSFKKYKKSILLSYYAKKKLALPKTYLLKLKISNYIKIIIVWVLTLIGKEDIYLDKIGRKPFDDEKDNHLSLIYEK